MKRCSALLTIMEMQIKTIVSCHFMLTRMAVIKKQIMRILARMWSNWNLYTLLVGTEKCNCFVKQSQKKLNAVMLQPYI